MRDSALGKIITKVDTCDDNIVYTGGIDHLQFVRVSLFEVIAVISFCCRQRNSLVARLRVLVDMVSSIGIQRLQISYWVPGKVFYLTLDGDGKMPVLHFGMTGMLQVPPL